jgi:hypothetical protein
VVISAYPAWKSPTSGLSFNVGQTACTSENLLLRRNTSRKLDVWRRERRNVHHLWRMMPHENTEKMARITSTNFEIGLEFTMISRNVAPDVDGKRCSVKLSVHAAGTATSGVGLPALLPGREPGLMGQTVSRRKMAVKHMLSLDFSLLS